MHPLLALLAAKPQLLLEHAQAYAALFQEELRLASKIWYLSILWQALALCFLGVAAVLAGVATLLWAVTPGAAIHAPWLLLAMPLLALVMALGCIAMALRQLKQVPFAVVGQQMSADMALLNQVSPP